MTKFKENMKHYNRKKSASQRQGGHQNNALLLSLLFVTIIIDLASHLMLGVHALSSMTPKSKHMAKVITPTAIPNQHNIFVTKNKNYLDNSMTIRKTTSMQSTISKMDTTTTNPNRFNFNLFVVSCFFFIMTITSSPTLSQQQQQKFMLVQPVHAMSMESTIKQTINHKYIDPAYPQCRRTIEFIDSTRFKYSGVNVNYSKESTNTNDNEVTHGCSYKEIQKYGLIKEETIGDIITNADGSYELQFMEPKTGQLLTGIVIQDSSSNGGGSSGGGGNIQWSNGNQWTVQTKPLSTIIGEFIFYAYIGFSTLAGVKGFIDGVKRKQKQEGN